MKKTSRHWCMDLETISNLFLGVFLHYKTNERHTFVISSLRDDREYLYDFLKDNIKNGEWHISFNGLNFDSQITQFILKNEKKIRKESAEKAAEMIYEKAQDSIGRSKRNEFQEYQEKDIPIKQLDICNMNGWNGKQRHASLKWVMYAMDWHNIQEMPIHHSTRIENHDQLDEVINYCINDTEATKQAMIYSKEIISMRQSLSKDFDLQLQSASEPRLSREIFLKFLSEEMNIPKNILKKSQTLRTTIALKDIMFPYLKFQTSIFKKLFSDLDNYVIEDSENLKGVFSKKVKYKGVEMKLGMGGIHGVRKGIYESQNGMIIIDSDVAGYYVNLAVENDLHPAHIPKEIFCNRMKWFKEERKKLPKTDPKNTAFKLVGNSTIGLSNEKSSPLKDVQFFVQVTVNGQLSLCMLSEAICENIPGAVPIQQNTDGITTLIPANYKEKYLELCSEWEKMTKLTLEHEDYKKMIMPDGNSYIGITKKGKVKCKGRFEWEVQEKHKVEALHKNKSFLIVSKALYAYFVNNIPPEKYLIENRNIYDYCAGVRTTVDWKFQMTCVEEGKITYLDLQNTIRYYISEKGCKIVKRNIKDNRTTQTEAGKWMQQLFNQYVEMPWAMYGVDDSYYLNEIYKEITKLTPKKKIQQELF